MRLTSLYTVSIRLLLTAALVTGFCLLGGTVVAQEETPEPAGDEAAPAAPAPAPAEVPAEEPPKTKKKIANGLYVEMSAGYVTLDDIDTSTITLESHTSPNILELESINTRAAIGWRLPHGKGDFRLRFTGYSEDNYRFASTGKARLVDPDLNIPSGDVKDLLDWWKMTIVNGDLNSQRTPPQWTTADDANGDGVVQGDEVTYPFVDLEVHRTGVTNLQNRTQAIDMLYGRRFGGRRFSGRWWGGLRYFLYEGNLLSAAWLDTSTAGEGYTEGALLKPIVMAQKAEGAGPTGALEANFNFFDGRLTLYVMGEVAFTLLTLESDTGPFTTLTKKTPAPFEIRPIAAQLQSDRSKSTWQDAAELGLRVAFKNGIGLELAYNITGYLDTVYVPLRLRIPAKPEESAQGTSATYRTSDLVMKGWRAGVSFQF